MSTHVTHFCDSCNQDRESTSVYDGGASAITYSEYPVGDGWAEFECPYTDSLGYRRTYEVHICGHCLADPEFMPKPEWKVSEWDEDSRKHVEEGQRLAEAFVWAQENLSRRGKWNRWEGVRQVFHDAGSYPYGYLVGPKLADGRYSPSDKLREDDERRAA